MFAQIVNKTKELRIILTSYVILLYLLSSIQASYYLSEENQKKLINAYQLPELIDGRNIRASIIDGLFNPYSDTQDVLSQVTKDNYQGKNLNQLIDSAHTIGHDHANHVASSLHNIAPKTELRVIDLYNDLTLSHIRKGDLCLIAALDEAIRSKVDFINISLRICPDNDWNESISNNVKSAFIRVRDAGIGVIKSAGNDQEYIGSTAYTKSLVELLEEMNDSMILVVATEYNINGQHEELANFFSEKFNFKTQPLNSKLLITGSNLAGSAYKYTISAPGKNNYAYDASNSRIIMSGTSMAAPIVAGAACLVKGAYPELTSKEVLKYILKSARTKSFPESFDLPAGKYGQGIVDLKRTLRTIDKHFNT